MLLVIFLKLSVRQTKTNQTYHYQRFSWLFPNLHLLIQSNIELAFRYSILLNLSFSKYKKYMLIMSIVATNYFIIFSNLEISSLSEAAFSNSSPLAAAFICQMTVNLMLLFIPGVLG